MTARLSWHVQNYDLIRSYIFRVKAAWILTRFISWPHQLFVKWFPGLSSVYSVVSIKQTDKAWLPLLQKPPELQWQMYTSSYQLSLVRSDLLLSDSTTANTPAGTFNRKVSTYTNLQEILELKSRPHSNSYAYSLAHDNNYICCVLFGPSVSCQ